MAGNSVANAIVNFIPKFADKSLSAIENQLDKSGRTGGAKLMAGLKMAAGAAVVAEAGKIAAQVFMDAFNNASEFEQLSGGVEKIFDEMDTSVIYADAKNAFQTLNMSVNDYLETINDVGASFAATMGDARGYEVAKQGLQAIADYASGTGKSVDVLKDKFAMITRSTSSYQSIADQFSGVLPATSAGFLEQAQAAGLLSSSYKKLTDVPVAEYQEAVAAMLEKGVTDLGLYQNTANETAGTVSGSLAALSASWENMLTAMGTGEDVEAMANQLVDSFIVALGNIIPLAGRVMAGMGSALMTALGNVLTQAVNAVAGWYGQFETAAVNMIDGLVQGIWDGAGRIVAAMADLARNAVDSFKHALGIASPSKVMREMGGYMGEGLALGIEDKQRRVFGAMGAISGASLAGAYSSAAASGAGASPGATYNVYINGARVNDTDGINATVGDFLLQLQRKAVL